METTEFHERMSKLYEEDPEAFEEEAEALVEDCIRSAPDHLQLKLRALQAKVNSNLRKAGEENRLATMQGMFWEKFLGEFAPVMKELHEGFKEKDKDEEEGV